jgi:putative methionine-R-sulfoxide reductase with GAF domain
MYQDTEKYSNIKPPSRKTLYLSTKFGFPLAIVGTITSIVIVLFGTTVIKFAVIWALISFFAVTVIWIANNYPNVEFFQKFKFLQSKNLLSYTSAGWFAIIFLVAAHMAGKEAVYLLWPSFILPFTLFITDGPKEKSLTGRVLIFTILTIGISVLGEFLSLPESTEGLRNSIFLLHPSITIGLWLIIAFLVIYYAVRRSQLEQIRSNAMYSLMLRFLEIEDPIASAEDLAKLIFERGDVGKRVFVIYYDSNQDILKVIACKGQDSENTNYYEIPKGKGISRRAIKERRTIYEKDISKCDYYDAGGLPISKGSEFSVPIQASEDKDEEVNMAINVQEDFIDAFLPEDIITVEKFAKLIGSFSPKYSGSHHKIISERLQILNHLNDPDIMIEEIVEATSELFDCKLVSYFQLAPGTSIPLYPPFLQGELKLSYFDDPNLKSSSSILSRWIKEWREQFIHNVKYDKELSKTRSGLSKILKEENITSVCFLPIGTKNIRIGALILFFTSQKIFSRYDQMKLLSFANEIGPHLMRVAYLSKIITGFARPQIQVHSFLSEVDLGKGALETFINEAIDLIMKTNPILYERILKVRDSLNTFTTNLRIWDSKEKSYTIFLESEMKNLANVLSGTFMTYKARYNGNIIWRLDPKIETFNNEFKLILYCMITEAVKNAFIHGKRTNEVKVYIDWKDQMVVLDISDNGEGFNPNDYSPNPDEKIGAGIFYLDKTARRIMGAFPIDWTDTRPGSGAHLIWKIPTLPIDSYS